MLVLLSAALLAPAGAAQQRPAILERAMQLSIQENRGIIGERAHLSAATQAFGMSMASQVEAGYVFVDGRAVAARLYSAIANGKELPSGLRDKLRRGVEQEVVSPSRSPLSGKSAADYRYSEDASCDDCASGMVRISFNSAVRDGKHFDGHMWIDVSAHVTKVVASPAAVSGPVVASTTTSTYGAVGPGMWAETHRETRATVKQFFVTANSNGTERFDHYRRFPSLAAASAALERNAL